MDTASSPAKPLAYSYVRMSTDIQLKGDSLRRQMELSREYAEKNDLQLVESEEWHDIGVSAFKGANVATDAALGRFIAAVEAGKIPRGSYLLVESLDRLSRQEAELSLSLLFSILQKGVHVITLVDGQVYKAGETTALQLMWSVTVMSRAHEESQMKSRRLRAAWDNKRKYLQDRKLTAQGPGWLKLSADRKSFEIIEERAAIVRRIFEMSAAGIGTYSIVRKLNAEGIDSFGPSNGWQSSSIGRFLRSRSVLGEYQPQRLCDDGREDVGEPIKDYYPAIIDESLFYRAQDARAQRKTAGRGRKGSNISNLFSGLAKCGYCGSSMQYVNKGPGPKGGTYLVCSSSKRGFSCERAAWRYDGFEAFFLSCVEELDLEQIVRTADETAERHALERSIEELRGKIGELEEQRSRTFDAFIASGEEASDFIKGRFRAFEERISTHQFELASKEKERDDLRAEASRFYESKDQIKDLVSRFRHKDDQEIYKLRAQISSKLKSLISSLNVFNAGEAPVLKRIIAEAESHDLEAVKDVIDQLRAEAAEPKAQRPYIMVAFRHALTDSLKVKTFIYNPDDPLRADGHLLINADGLHRVENGKAEPIRPNVNEPARPTTDESIRLETDDFLRKYNELYPDEPEGKAKIHPATAPE